MPAFWMEATLYTLDEEKYAKLVKKWHTEIMRGAVRKFLQATTRAIPVRTGFLRGAFSDIRKEFSDEGNAPDLNPVLRALTSAFSFKDEEGKTVNVDTRKLFLEREKEKDAKINAAGREARIRALKKEMHKGLRRQNKGKKKDERGRMTEWYYSGTGKAAKKIAKTPRSGIQFATKPEDVLKFNGNMATFFLDVAISYYRVNDNSARIKGAPWKSMLAGGTAMAQWLGRAADLFPAITEILAKQKISLRGSRLLQTKLPQEVVNYRFLRITGMASTAAPLPTGAAPASTPEKASDKNALIRARLKAAREAKVRATQPERIRLPQEKNTFKPTRDHLGRFSH
jgi:hypothetical protein